jgi:hypothetical protein
VRIREDPASTGWPVQGLSTRLPIESHFSRISKVKIESIVIIRTDESFSEKRFRLCNNSNNPLAGKPETENDGAPKNCCIGLSRFHFH